MAEKLYNQVFETVHNKVVCIGRNYADHAKEMKSEVPKEPILFDKALSRIVKSGDILYLRGEHEVHHEVELGVLIGKTGKNIQAADWRKHVEGYFIGIDFTDRDLQGQAKKNGSPWTLSKSQDGFFAVSGFVDVDKVRNPHNLELSLKVNHKKVQCDNTKNMIFQIPNLIEYITKYMTLREGDMILTGTPAGVGPVQPGDYVYANLNQGLYEELASIYLKVERNMN